MIKAPSTPGIHPINVSINTMRKEPHPLSATARGGKIIANITLNTDMVCLIVRNSLRDNYIKI